MVYIISCWYKKLLFGRKKIKVCEPITLFRTLEGQWSYTQMSKYLTKCSFYKGACNLGFQKDSSNPLTAV